MVPRGSAPVPRGKKLLPSRRERDPSLWIQASRPSEQVLRDADTDGRLRNRHGGRWEEFPLEGKGEPSWGAVLPLGGSALPWEGFRNPCEGFEFPRKGWATPSEGWRWPSQGSGDPSRGSGFPPGGSGYPREGFGVPCGGWGIPLRTGMALLSACESAPRQYSLFSIEYGSVRRGFHAESGLRYAHPLCPTSSAFSPPTP
jgi:hypothetical protein